MIDDSELTEREGERERDRERVRERKVTRENVRYVCIPWLRLLDGRELAEVPRPGI